MILILYGILWLMLHLLNSFECRENLETIYALYSNLVFSIVTYVCCGHLLMCMYHYTPECGDLVFIEMFMPMMDLLVTTGISLTPDFGPTLQCGVPTVQPDRRWRGWPWLPWSRGALSHWQGFGGIHPMFVIERHGVTTRESQWPTPRIWLGFGNHLGGPVSSRGHD